MTSAPAITTASDGPYSRTAEVREEAIMNVINNSRSTLEKYMPLLIGLLIAFLAGKALKRSFWTLFVMYCAVRSIGMHGLG
jgi:hypothetical protein